MRADLRLVDFAQADLRGADFSGAVLRAVNLVGAIYDGTTVWPQGFRPGLSVVKKLVVALDSEAPESTLAGFGRASFGENHLLQQKMELKAKYDTLSRRIAALDTDLGRALDSLSRQILEEQRKEFAAQREEIAAQMTRIEEQLGS